MAMSVQSKWSLTYYCPLINFVLFFLAGNEWGKSLIGSTSLWKSRSCVLLFLGCWLLVMLFKCVFAPNIIIRYVWNDYFFFLLQLCVCLCVLILGGSHWSSQIYIRMFCRLEIYKRRDPPYNVLEMTPVLEGPSGCMMIRDLKVDIRWNKYHNNQIIIANPITISFYGLIWLMKNGHISVNLKRNLLKITLIGSS